MKTRTKILSVAILSTAFCGTAGAVLYGYGPAENWTIAEIMKLQTSVGTNITTFGSSFSAQMQTKFENIISAVAVATKQEALSANIVSDGTREASEQLVNAVRAQRQSDQVAKAFLDYNPATGQGFDPCGTSAKNRTLDVAFADMAARARNRVGTTDVAPGRLVPSVGAAMQQRLAEHRDKFCTASEAQAGLCSTSQLPGGDTNAALLFEPASPSTLQGDARAAYIQHVLGQPDAAIPRSAGGTPAGQEYLLAKNRKDSLLSVPAYSLAMIDAANTRSDELQGKSPNEVLKLRVNQYFGGAEAEKWSGALARQSQRGLLVETAKMAGLEAWVNHEQYKQNQRIEANLAALLVASADRLSVPLEGQYQRVLHETSSRDVR
ncbi:hypothetical protein QYF96_16655 [Xanthomonas euvesicatoria]|uniref:TraW n=1 Tax=Xanthomonas euvesicatoria TaxID=456327 RepID=A0AAX4FRD6_XANEU|nr:hypothetical protein [Xanthomonas euvesicatoria]WOP59073.1 hypothetical protein R5577_22730 [Xanthomonas euvesicatoria]